MNFNNPIPRATQPRFHEGSGLRSVRDSDALAVQWKKERTVSGQSADYGNALARIQRELIKLRRRQLGYMQGGETLSHPFKIYQPTNYAQFATGITFLGTDGTPTTCNIDATKPTDFTATPPTVNPTTDAWRFWAVRSGLITLRPIYSIIRVFTPDNSDLGYNYIVDENSDGISSFYSFNEFDNPTTSTSNPPLIMSGNPDPYSGGIAFEFWIKITPDTNGAEVPSAAIAARTTNDSEPTKDGILPASSPNMIPIGSVFQSFDLSSFIPSMYPEVVSQTLFDNVLNRFPPGNGNFGSGGVMNFRGVYQKSSATFTPDDLDQQVFYPGDCVFVTNAGGVDRARSLYQYTAVNADFWDGDPFFSGNWKFIFVTKSA